MAQWQSSNPSRAPSIVFSNSPARSFVFQKACVAARPSLFGYLGDRYLPHVDSEPSGIALPAGFQHTKRRVACVEPFRNRCLVFLSYSAVYLLCLYALQEPSGRFHGGPATPRPPRYVIVSLNHSGAFFDTKILGPQILHPRKIIMARRNISPKTIETIYLSNGPREHALPILHIQGLFNLENIVRVDDDSTSQSRDKSSSPQQVPTPHELGVHCKPISNSVLREPRQIPHRIDERSRVPSIRTLPSDLYTVLGAKTSGPIASTPAENGRPPFPPPGLAKVPYPREREPPRTKAQCSPIGSDRYEWSSPFLGTAADVGLSAEPTVCPSPGSRTAPRKAPDLMLPFVDILSENKRKNPHAPAMVSMFNPLRGDVRFRAWASMAVQRAGRKPVGGLTLPSARFQTSLYAIPARSRA